MKKILIYLSWSIKSS